MSESTWKAMDWPRNHETRKSLNSCQGACLALFVVCHVKIAASQIHAKGTAGVKRRIACAGKIWKVTCLCLKCQSTGHSCYREDPGWHFRISCTSYCELDHKLKRSPRGSLTFQKALVCHVPPGEWLWGLKGASLCHTEPPDGTREDEITASSSWDPVWSSDHRRNSV